MRCGHSIGGMSGLAAPLFKQILECASPKVRTQNSLLHAPRLAMASWIPPPVEVLVDSDVPAFDFDSWLERQGSPDSEEPEVKAAFFLDLGEEYLATIKAHNKSVQVAQAERRARAELEERAARRAERIRKATAEVAARKAAEEAERVAEEARKVRILFHSSDRSLTYSSTVTDQGGRGGQCSGGTSCRGGPSGKAWLSHACTALTYDLTEQGG
jgi:hypothetical protein